MTTLLENLMIGTLVAVGVVYYIEWHDSKLYKWYHGYFITKTQAGPMYEQLLKKV